MFRQSAPQARFGRVFGLSSNPTVHVQGVGHAGHMPDDVKQLLATEAALDKLGARGISTAEAGQTLWNRHVVIKNLRGSPERPQRDARGS
jgi:hypothetical protein